MGNKVQDYLAEWTINYLKNKDAILMKIESIDRDKDGFDVYVRYKDKEQFFVVRPLIEDAGEVLSKLDPDRHFGLIVFNNEKNLKCLLDNWDKFVNIRYLAVFFVNPSSRLDKRWVICPYTHNNICEQNSLEKGLRSMFEMVEPLSEEEIRKIGN